MFRRLQIGEQLGDYRIAGFLGAGGMGSVYHAVHTKIDRPVAIKVLSDVAQNPSFRERFFNEARLQSRLHHPNIATLYDFQEVGDLVYIVMEFVDGETLDGLIKQRYFAVEEALRTFETVCEAVAFIHGSNIVHRDIKPQNIKMSSAGTIKMLDFGIAKGALNQGLTRVGGVIGTPNYLSPEQLQGHEASAHSDTWALGVLFFEMLTGDEPFKGRTLAELQLQITTAKFTNPEDLNPAIPATVANIVRKCLTVDVSQRYQSVADLISDVRRAQERYRTKSENLAKGRLRDIFVKTGSRGESLLPSSEPSDTKPPISVSNGLKVALVSAAVVISLMVVGAGIWANMGPSPKIAGDTSGKSNSPEVAPGPVITKTVTTPPGPAIQSGTAASGTLQRVTVDSTEGKAEVYRNGELVGVTPVEIEGRENESVPLKLKRNGYEDLDVVVEIAVRKKINTFSLKRK